MPPEDRSSLSAARNWYLFEFSDDDRKAIQLEADFEKSLWENYNVTPEYYEDLGDGIYQVYVKIDGKTVPYVCVDSATGDYHG